MSAKVVMKLEKDDISLILSSIFVLFIIILFVDFGSTASCWTYTSSSTCTSGNGCIWKNDSWNPTGWCEELNCWSLNAKSSCTTTTVPGKNCTWQGGGTTYSCNEIS